MLHTAFYDPTKSYEENYESGPFGAFADGKKFESLGTPAHNYFDNLLFLPFGIPAGPLINSNFVKGAFEKGFDVCVYKTVRSDTFPCHPHPNVLSVTIDGDLTPDRAKLPVVADTNYHEPISITNSFGVPSRKPEQWQADVIKAKEYAGPGQLLVLSFMGTTHEGQTRDEFIDDFATTAILAKETGVKVLEIDISCPNIGNEGLVCYDLEMTEAIAKAARSKIGDTPLVLKVGYYQNTSDIEKLALIAERYAQDIAAINTLQATIVDENGNQALPGSPVRLRGGVCGHGIKWAGISMVERLREIREKNNYTFKITGVGGVTVPQDYFDYINAGADVVMSATGAMWNPYLAQEIKKISTS